MSRNLYIAGLHFGYQTCIGFDGRLILTNIDEHDKMLLTNWNAVVMLGDHVYVVEDFAYRNEKPVSYYTNQLRGHIHLIRGNYDKRSAEHEGCFESVDDILKIGDMLYVSPVEVIMCPLRDSLPSGTQTRRIHASWAHAQGRQRTAS